MSSLLIEGEKIQLRRITMEDADAEYLSWLNDEEVVKTLETVTRPYTMEMLKAYVAGVIANTSAYMFIITDKASGAKIGTSRIHNISERHGTCNIGIMIGNKNFWGKGLGQDAYHTLIGFAFGELKIRKIYEAVNANNPASLAMFSREGFREEGVLRKQVISEGQYVDKILLGLFADEWQK